jgi:hypothetical protein
LDDASHSLHKSLKSNAAFEDVVLDMDVDSSILPVIGVTGTQDQGAHERTDG